MSKKNQHVVPTQDGWGVRGAGNGRLTSRHETQADAFEAAREIAINQRSEVVIHRPNGQIRDSNSYGNDPFPPKG
jgi:cytochrome b